MKILVTGGAGFIGSHLVRRLVGRPDADVTVLDNLRRGSLQQISDVQSRIRFIEGDIRNRDAVRAAVGNVDVLFHLAAQSNVLGAVSDLEYSFSTNVVGTFEVLNEALRAGVRRVIFTSSREVYGEREVLPVREDAPLNPKNAYGISKAAGELYCRAFTGRGLEIVILRLANVYGPGDRDRVIPLFIGNARRGAALTLYGLNKVLDFVWIGDVVDALWEASQRDVAGECMNVGTGQGTKLEDLARRIIGQTGSRSQIEFAPARGAEVDRFVADISCATRLLGYCPQPDPLHHLPVMLGNHTV